MPEVEGQEKTEQATSKKLSDSRDEGQVARSMEINSFAIFTTGLFILYFFQQFIGKNIAGLSTNIFRSLDILQLNRQLVIEYAKQGVMLFAIILAPIFIGLLIIGTAANISQVGFKISPKALKPKMQNLNILKGFKKVFFSTRSLNEVLKSVAKLFIIGLFTYLILSEFIWQTTELVNYSVIEILSFMIESAYSLLWKIAIIFAVIAAVDYSFQKYKFKKDMMMTKQEVKEEMKQTEGDPIIKSRIRKMQLMAAKNRMMQNVPKADVVITNPTHYAVAIKYEISKDEAPKVVAKGVDELAQRIKQIAAENNVPLHENRELARSLYKVCEVGDMVPSSLFQAVAKVLAYVYQLKNNQKKKSII